MTARARFVALDQLWRSQASSRDIHAAISALGVAIAADAHTRDRLEQRVRDLEPLAAIGRAARLAAVHGASAVLEAATHLTGSGAADMAPAISLSVDAAAAPDADS